ncbi:phosphotransferase [Novosphingobium terrae]|uniref:phosphotransferase n=1 Tax=Novosphingobium terrae TaxID=2726189 RepID=UPI00197D2F86|nr:phosphotransferase [Novosphingobium terrae]
MSPAELIAMPPEQPDQPLWLILSGAYVGQELAIELGQLPPSMIPVGHSRLYEMQLDAIGPGQRVYLALPAQYQPPIEDLRRLRDRGVQIVQMPEGLTLGEAVVYAFNYIGVSDHPVRILHGDTFVRDIPEAIDTIAVASSSDDYQWADVEVKDGLVTKLHTASAGANGGDRLVATGYFACSSCSLLLRSIVLSHGDFIAGLQEYNRQRPLQASSVEQWLDFGHIQTFFQSRRSASTARAFNDVRIGQHVVRKSSASNAQKIRAETRWLADAPPALLPFCSRVIDSGEGPDGPFYETEYEYMLTLSELYLFGSIGRTGWTRVVNACADFLQTCASLESGAMDNTTLRLLTNNMFGRLERFARETGFDIEAPTALDGSPLPSLLAIAEQVQARIDLETPRPQRAMHGDFCFSNIFYNARARRVRVIDPRGFAEEGVFSHYGDSRYDMAKLAHSAIGQYDLIIGGRYHCERQSPTGFKLEFENTPGRLWLKDAFGEITVQGQRLACDEIQAIMTGLFLSMLPLHSDRPDRQQAFIANALRLFKERS